MISTQSVLVFKGENSQFDELMPVIEGSNASYQLVKTFDEARAAIAERVPAVLLMDLLVDGRDATDFLNELKSEGLSNQIVSVIFSDRKEKYVEVAALNAGADDFRVKPVNKRVFGSRLQTWLRQSACRSLTKPSSRAIGEVILDYEKFLAIVNNEPIDLQRKEFEIISLLVSKPRKVFSREEIIESLWSNQENVRERTIDVHIRNLRTKIGPRHIKTYKGIGYSYDVR